MHVNHRHVKFLDDYTTLHTLVRPSGMFLMKRLLFCAPVPACMSAPSPRSYELNSGDL